MRRTLTAPQAQHLVIHSRGRLPHWDVPEGTYSMTWRLADSLPEQVRIRLTEEYARMKAEVLGKGPLMAIERAQLSEEFFLQYDRALDGGYGSCVLRDPSAAAIVRDSLLFLGERNYFLLAWSIMPNHVHAVFRLRPGVRAWQTMHSLKGYTSHEINKLLGRSGTLWQKDYFDTIIRSPRQLTSTIEYVRNNPIHAGLKNWPWIG